MWSVNLKPAKSGPGARAGDRIRDTATRLFYRQGIRAVGVDAIVRQARATKPSLYRSFRSKDDLAAAYLRDWDSAFWQRFDSAVAAHPAGVGARDILGAIANPAPAKSSGPPVRSRPIHKPCAKS